MSRALTLKTGTMIAVLLLSIVSLGSLDRQLKLQDDSAIYMSLAKSLYTGQGYRNIHLIGSPPHSQYPPAFPLLLVPVMLLLGPDFLAMKLLLVALAILALLPLAALYRDLTDEGTALLVVLLTATTHGIIFFTQSIMTEIPYLLFSLLALVWINRCARQGRWTGGSVAIAGLLISLAYLNRIIGLSLLVAAVLHVALDGRGTRLARARMAAVIGGVGALPFVLWLFYIWWASRQVGFIPYARYYSHFLAQAAPSASGDGGPVMFLWKLYASLYAYAVHAGNIIVYFTPASPSGRLLALVPATITFAGFLWCVRRRRTVVEYYVGAYLCALLTLPGSRQQRYLVPLVPFIWYYFLVATGGLLRWIGERWPARGSSPRPAEWRIAAGLAAVLLVSNVTAGALVNVVWHGNSYYERLEAQPYREMLSWARENTAPDSVFMWDKPSLGYVLADRRAVRIPFGGPERTLRFIQEADVDYVVVHSGSKAARRLLPFVERYPQHLRLVHWSRDLSVYRVIGSRQGGPGGVPMPTG